MQVFKGRWHSSDVAIKIITVRTPEELPKVLREAEVMMQLDHTNVVRAFHASVWNPMEQVRVGCLSGVLSYDAAPEQPWCISSCCCALFAHSRACVC
jgi:serine/threonine protein kinase